MTPEDIIEAVYQEVIKKLKNDFTDIMHTAMRVTVYHQNYGVILKVKSKLEKDNWKCDFRPLSGNADGYALVIGLPYPYKKEDYDRYVEEQEYLQAYQKQVQDSVIEVLIENNIEQEVIGKIAGRLGIEDKCQKLLS